MSNMVKYRGGSFKKDQIAALYLTMSDIVHRVGLTITQPKQNCELLNVTLDIYGQIKTIFDPPQKKINDLPWAV